MTEYEYKLHILCQRSHDKDPDTFKKMMREMVNDYSQAILSAEEAKVRECKEDLMEVKNRIKIPNGIFSPKDYPYENGFLAGTNECLSKLVHRLPDETKTTTENPLSLPDQEQLSNSKTND